VSIGWDADCLVSGFHAPEPAEMHRWTDGQAAVPSEFISSLYTGTTITLHINGMLPYPVGKAADNLHADAA
jgi:hypothetical protein